MDLPPPPSSTSPAPPPAAATAPSVSRSRWILPGVFAVAGIGVGVLIGGLAFGGRDDGGGAELTGGAADADAGCRLLAQVPDEIDFEDDGWGVEGPNLWRVEAVSAAFTAAANEDREFRGVGEDAGRVRQAYQRFDVDEANDALADVRDWCADRDGAAD